MSAVDTPTHKALSPFNCTAAPGYGTGELPLPPLVDVGDLAGG